MPLKPGAVKYDYLGLDEASIKRSLSNRLVYPVGKDTIAAKDLD